MALMARSIEMSFSLSRLRRTLRSMSIGLPLVPPRALALVRCAPTAELDLHLAGSQLLIAELSCWPPISRTTPSGLAVMTRPSTVSGYPGAPGASGARTSRPCARRQCRSAVSGRSTPGELTSSVYAVSPMTPELSSSADSDRLSTAMSSRPGPPSASTTMRSRRRRPAAATRTDSRSRPADRTTGSSTRVSCAVSAARSA